MNKNRLYLMYGSVISLALLAIFFTINKYQAALLTLDTKWIIVAGIPLLAGLIAGKFITKIEALGWTIEAVGEAKVDDAGVVTRVEKVNFPAPGYPTSEIASNEALCKANVLVFWEGQPLYRAADLKEYLDKMPSLKYFEIVDREGEFLSLRRLTCDFFDIGKRDDKVGKFLDEISADIPPDKHISSRDSVLDVLEKLEQYDKEYIAVLTDTGRRLKGIVCASDIGKYFADLALKEKELRRNSSIAAKLPFAMIRREKKK